MPFFIRNLLKTRSKLLGFSDLLGYALFYDEQTIMLKDGAFSASFRYRGPDLNSSTGEELDSLSANINHALRLLQDGWMIEFNLLRSGSQSYSKSQYFPDSVSALIDDERRSGYEREGTHFDTKTYCSLTWLPEKEINCSIKKFAIESEYKINETTLDEIHEKFEESLAHVMDVLRRYLMIERLSNSELLTFLHQCITGKTHPVAVPHSGMHLDTYLASQEFFGGLSVKVGEKHVHVLHFMDLPVVTRPSVLECLNHLSLEYRWATRFIPLGIDSARDYLKKIHRGWDRRVKGFFGLLKETLGASATANLNYDALEMREQTRRAQTLNEGELVRYGLLTNTLLLCNEDKENLKEATRLLIRELQQKGFLIREESINAVEGFLGSIPSHGYYNVRRSFVDSVVLSHLILPTSVYQGEPHCPCPLYPPNAPPLFYAKTAGATPFYFNLHVEDVGHTMIIGPTGSGKSTLLGLIVAQHRKYSHSHIFVFDKDYSNQTLLLALGGDFFDIGRDSRLSFSPLCSIEEEETFNWACSFIEEFVLLQNIPLSPERKNAIRAGLTSLKNTDKRFWSINALRLVIQDEVLRTALEPYCVGFMNQIFSSKQDVFKETSLLGFEMGWLLEQREEIYIPLLSYLFHRLHHLFKRRNPCLLILEEAWLYLDNKIFARKLKDWLKTLRKFNVSVLFTTQSLSDVKESSIRSILLESCSTKIYLPNDRATDTSKSFYKSCGLNQQQIEIIAKGRPKREYYVQNAYGNRLIELGLGEVALAFTAVSHKKDLEAFQKIFNREDPHWIFQWLCYKDLHGWAQFWRKNYA